MDLQLVLIGTEPLLMHNEQLADPLNTYSKLLKPLTSKRANQKTDQDHLDIAMYEFLGGLYYSEHVGVYIPFKNIRACFYDGGTFTRQGTIVQAAIKCLLPEIPLLYTGPKSGEELWKQGFYSRDGVGINRGSRTMRTRPKFPIGWQLAFDLLLDPEILNLEDLTRIVHTAGERVGLGGNRINGFGRFEATIKEVRHA